MHLQLIKQRSEEERERLAQKRREQGLRLKQMSEKRREERMRTLEQQLNNYVELLDSTSASASASETAVRAATNGC